MAGISPGQIGGIVAHGTGTPTNDGVEIDALRLAFGTVPLPPLTSLKAAIGHSQAGAGATALAAAIMMLNKGIMPGTASLHEVDPALGDVDVVSSPRAIAQPCLLINAFGFGGNNCVFVVADQALAWRLP
jgi:3-oxoacyl-[acyl-carrier-protein] synthase II